MNPERFQASPGLVQQELVAGVVTKTSEKTDLSGLIPGILLVVLAIMLVGLLSTYQKRRPVVFTQEVILDADHKPWRRRKSERSNRSILRQIYRDFLKQQRGRGLNLLPYYTS